jgi:HAMP domain-containing protein
LLDLNWLFPIERLSAPSIQIYLLIAVGIAAILPVYLILRQFANYSLRTKLIITFLAVTLIPLGVLTFINNNAMQNSLNQATRQRLFTAATQTADMIDSFISANLDALAIESQLPEWGAYLSLPPNQRSGSQAETEALALLNLLQRKSQLSGSPNIFSYALLDGAGQVLIDTYPSYIGADESDRTYFKSALQLDAGRTYVSPVEFLPGTSDGYLYFSSPIKPAQQVLGVLRVIYSADVLQGQLVAGSAGLAGEKSFAVLVDKLDETSYMFLAHGTASDLVYKTVMPLDSAGAADLRAAHRLPDQPAAEPAANLADLQKNLDARYFTAPLTAAGGAPDVAAVASLKREPWSLIFAQPQSVSLLPIADQTRATLTLVLLIAGIVALSALGVAQVLARPITSLTEMAGRLTQGDLAARAEVRSRDEIGLLGNTFNTMAGQMQDLISSLEARVVARGGRGGARRLVHSRPARAAAASGEPDLQPV